MLSAKEAKRQSIVNSIGKKYLDELEKAIEKAIKNGECSTIIFIDMVESDRAFDDGNNGKIRNAIVDELVNLGYTVDFKYAEPLPLGCRSDQWNFNNGYIKVEW